MFHAINSIVAGLKNKIHEATTIMWKNSNKKYANYICLYQDAQSHLSFSNYVMSKHKVLGKELLMSFPWLQVTIRYQTSLHPFE